MSQPCAQTQTIESLEFVVCPICQVDDGEVIYPSRRTMSLSSADEFRASGDEPLQDPLVRCRRCGARYVNPRFPADRALEGYASGEDETFVSQAKWRESTFRRSLAVIASLRRERPGVLLDIGTANGSFLKVAQDAGWRVHGCEPNHFLRRWCQEHYGIVVTPGTVFDGNYPPGSFDVITLWDVLEHTPDPRALLVECQRLLSPGGLVVLTYPDIGSWIARWMGRRWAFLISVHYYYFTRKTMTRLLQEAGFKPIQIRPHFQTLSLDYVLFRAQPLMGPWARGLRKLTSKAGLSSLPISYWMGQVRVAAVREKERMRRG